MKSEGGGKRSAKRTSDCQFPCDLAQEDRKGLCAALSPEEIERLRAIARSVPFARRQPVFYEGDPAEFFYEVRSGVLRISKTLADGRRQVTGFLYPGDFLGFALDGSYVYSAEAIRAAQLCRFPQTALRNLLERSPSLNTSLFAIASNELAMAQEQLLLLGRKSAREKVASFLTMLARRARNTDAGLPVVELPMSRSDISDYLGLSLESVSRALTSLQRQGLIEIVPSRITLLDTDQLKQLAAGDKAA